MAIEIVKASDNANKNIKVLLFGESGLKKTRFATDFNEGAIVLDLEGGLGSAVNPDIDSIRCKDSKDFAEALEWLKTDTKYHTVICDSWTEYGEKLFLALKVVFPDKADGMNLWGMFDTTLRSRHDALMSLDKNIITIALEESVITDMIAKAYPMIKAKKFKAIIGAKYDMVGHMHYDNDGKRAVNFAGTDYAIGKNRFEGKGIPNLINEEEELFSARKIFEKIQGK